MSALAFLSPAARAELERLIDERARAIAADAGAWRRRYLTVGEAAEYLRWKPKRLYNLTAADAIPHRKHEGRISFLADELDAWLDGFREGPLAPLAPSSGSTYRGADHEKGPAAQSRSGPGNGKDGSDADPA